MRLPSVQYLFEGLLRTVLRFPAAVIAAACACGLAWYMVGMRAPLDAWTKLLLTLTLGIPLFSGLTLMNERPALPKAAKPSYILLAGLLFLVFFFYALAVDGASDFKTQYLHWLFITLLFISFAPYLAAAEPNGFWQFNKRFIVRIVLSCFYTGVLFAGASLALAAVDKLLGIEVGQKVYQYLWIFAAYIFGPLHLLGGTPWEYPELEEDKSYPKGLKLFTQYVLIPLATVYFLILYAYMAKILYTRQWPQGWVSWLTSSASVLGLVTFLLLYPVKDREENRWINLYSRGFCAAAVPLLLMLFAAVFKRIAQYGLTEHRYFLLALAAWLLGFFLYFIFSRKPNIKLVPVSLVLAAVLSSFGPWGAYSVSLSSQLGRLEIMLLKNGLLVNGKTVKLEQELGWEERKQLSGCLDYIVRFHGVEPLGKYFARDLGPLVEKNKAGYWEASGVVIELMKYLGQNYLSQWKQEKFRHFSFSADKTGIDIRGFDLVVKFSTQYSLPKESWPGDNYSVVLNSKTRALKIFQGKRFVIEVPLKSMCGAISEKHKESFNEVVAQKLLSAGAENGNVKVKVYFQNLAGNRKEGGGLDLTRGDGLLLISEKTGGIAPSAQGGDCYSFRECFEKGYEAKVQGVKVACFTKALELWSYSDGLFNKVVVYNNRGIAYYELRRYGKSLADYAKAIELLPEDISAYYHRGLVHIRLKKYEEALADYGKVIELEQAGVPEPWQKGAGYGNRGVVFAKLNKHDLALADLNSAIALDPKSPLPYLNRGNSYRYLKDYGKALADYDLAIELDPSGAGCGGCTKGAAYGERGVTYLWLGKCEQAKADFEKALELDEKAPDTYTQLAVHWWTCRQNKEKALYWFRSSFNRGFDQWEELSLETGYGHFLKGLNDAPEFKELVRKYGKK